MCVGGGKHIKIMYGADIINSSFGDHGFIAHDTSLNDVVLGDYSSVGRYTKIKCADIGKYCSISWDVTIGAVEHPLTRISTSALTYKAEYNLVSQDIEYPQKRTTIGNDVWIGCNVVIKSGISIGDGAVIGAGSVCVKDIDPYTIVAGNPAKVIRKRATDKSIERLINLKWWDWPIEEIKENLHWFSEDLSEEVIYNLEIFREAHRQK